MTRFEAITTALLLTLLVMAWRIAVWLAVVAFTWAMAAVQL